MFNWNACDTVLLDMDGTLLDLNFDNHFWLEFVPSRYAELHQMSLKDAKQQLVPQFKAMEGKLEWYCLDYWTQVLGLDIVGLKGEISALIAVLPHVVEFLEALKHTSKQVLLVTNAHRGSLDLKMEQTCLQDFFDEIICSHDFGLAKEQHGFWQALQQQQGFDSQRTLLVDDSLAVLNSAHEFGIQHLINVLKPDTQKPAKVCTDYPAIKDFRELMTNMV